MVVERSEFWNLLVIRRFYTDYAFAPVRRIANASRTGHGTNAHGPLEFSLSNTAIASCSASELLLCPILPPLLSRSKQFFCSR